MLATCSSQRIRKPRVQFHLRQAVALLAIFIASAAGNSEDIADEIGITEPGVAEPGGQAPDFLLKDLEENALRLSGFRGKLVVLNFFASWCSPCLQELPIIQDAYVSSADKDFVVLGVGYQDSRWAIEELAEDFSLTFPIVIDGDNSVGQAYQVIGPPYTFFIDPTGIIVAVVAGAMEPETLQQNLEALLKTSRIGTESCPNRTIFSFSQTDYGGL